MEGGVRGSQGAHRRPHPCWSEKGASLIRMAETRKPHRALEPWQAATPDPAPRGERQPACGAFPSTCWRSAVAAD